MMALYNYINRKCLDQEQDQTEIWKAKTKVKE